MTIVIDTVKNDMSNDSTNPLVTQIVTKAFA